MRFNKVIAASFHPCVLILCAVLFTRCSHAPEYPPALRKALAQAGENRGELVKALRHYASPADSLKYKACVYLITHMPRHQSGGPDAAQLAVFDGILKEAYKHPKNGPFMDSVASARLGAARQGEAYYGREPVELIASVRAGDLINHIDAAFATWFAKPWARHYSFAEFCEWVLPVTIIDEPFKPWMAEVRKKYRFLEDSLKYFNNLTEACMYVNNRVNNTKTWIGADDVPMMSVKDMTRYMMGRCDHMFLMTAGVMRALGLPVAVDKGFLWTKYPGSHSWNVLLTENKQSYAFNGTTDYSTDPKLCAGIGIFPFYEESTPMIKVYRYTYSDSIGDADFNPRFDLQFLKDVTHQYDFPRQDTLVVTGVAAPEGSFVTLCGFDKGQTLTAVASSKVVGGHAAFPYVARGAALVVTDGAEQVLSNAFYINADGASIELAPNHANRHERLTLKRKYPLGGHVKPFVDEMIGGELQSSASRDFKHYKVVYKISEHEGGYEDTVVNVGPSDKYFRYVSMSNLNVAELAFAARDAQSGGWKGLEGQPYGYVSRNPCTKLKYNNQSDSTFTKAFDKDISTNFVAPAGSWLGLAVGAGEKPRQVRFGYLYRNDQNIVEPGDLYELMYFDKGWHVFDRLTATDNRVTFNNVPSNCLLLLRDLTRGADERIFMVGDGKQVWW